MFHFWGTPECCITCPSVIDCICDPGGLLQSPKPQNLENTKITTEKNTKPFTPGWPQKKDKLKMAPNRPFFVFFWYFFVFSGTNPG